MRVSVIRKYASLFYDVLDNVKFPEWANLNLVDDNPDRRDEPGFALFWKKLAVQGRSQVMLDLIAKFITIANEDLRKFTEMEVRKRLAMASHRMNITHREFARICPRVWALIKPEEKTMAHYLFRDPKQIHEMMIKNLQRHVCQGALKTSQ
jgi:hypothetical protein